MVQQNYPVLMPPYSVSQYDSSALAAAAAAASTTAPNHQLLTSSASSNMRHSSSLPQTHSSSNINNLFKQLIMPANMLPNQNSPLPPSHHQHHSSQRAHQHQQPILYPNQNLYSQQQQQQQAPSQQPQQQQQQSNLNQQNVYSQPHQPNSSFNNLAQYTNLSNVNFSSNNISNNISNSSVNMGILSRNSSFLRGLNAQTGSYENLENFKSLKSNKMNDGDNTSKIYGNALLGGSNIIWDKNDAFQGEKFGPKFEYLEIDEFLNENGLNESDVEFLDHLQKSEVNNNDTSTNSSTNNPANTGSTKATSSPNTTSSSTTSAQLNNLLTLSTSLSSVNSISSSSSTTSPSSSNSSTLDSSSSSSSSRPSSSSISLNQTVSSTSLTAPSSFLSNNTTQPIRNSNANPATAPNSLIRPACEPTLSFSNINKALPPVKPKDSNLNENLISSTSSNGSPRASTSSRLNSFDWSVNDDAEDGDELEDLEEYATRMRKFSSDDLKMQPTLKKSKKQFVPNELKDDKYWARRRKNNMAAKRSRDARRMKENQIAITASYLERENELLRKQLEDSRRETKLLKAKLARYESMLPMDGPK